jgi:hypothetical protein
MTTESSTMSTRIFSSDEGGISPKIERMAAGPGAH